MTNKLNQVSIDIQEARNCASFSTNDMNTFIRGGPIAVDRLRKMMMIADNEPLFDMADIVFKGRGEQLHYALKVSKRLIDLVEEHGLNDEEFSTLINYLDMLTPLGLHYSAFMSVIKSQGTPEQIGKWWNAAKRHAIIGCYAQTELSHGSNVMGLTTTATFDDRTDEFIIHSPNLMSAKWWIGGLGVASTHAVVQAQLVIGVQNFGPHLFIVPIRSPMDLNPCLGVTVGDIGPKAYGGFACVDNGFVLFDHVRIPRENMLMKFAKVETSGEYIPPVHNKLSYGSMVKLRVDIVYDAAFKLAKAVTISTRYCTVRRQFHYPTAKSGLELETQVIRYSSVQHRLFPLLSTAYALFITSESLYQTFNQLMSKLEINDASMLPQVHATTCALKSWSTRRSTDGIEECRKAMGGHGFSMFSGVADLFATFIPSNTYEGDNFVLAQQTARFILKQLSHVLQGETPSPTVEYLALSPDNRFQFKSYDQILDPEVQIQLFGKRALSLATSLKQQLSKREWSDLNMECWSLNFAHAEYIIMKELHTRVDEMKSSEFSAVAPMLKSISDLFCLSTIVGSSISTFLSTSTIHPEDLDGINEQYRNILSKVAEDAIPLTDSFGFTDRELNSALGKKDGNVYEALWERVQRNPINKGGISAVLRDAVLEILHRGDNIKYIINSKI